MRLYEHEGKALLAEAGVPVPRGRVLHAGEEFAPAAPTVLKVQVLQGRRGRRGGVRLLRPGDDAREVLRALFALRFDNDERAQAILVEESIAIARELYLSIRMDRRTQSAVVLASPCGGVDVEESPGPWFSLPIDPLLGLRGHHVRAVARHLGLSGGDLEPVLAGAWSVFQSHGCVLLEINPLVVDDGGRLTAADAKIETDDRHPSPEPGRFPRTGRLRTSFEEMAAELGAVGVEAPGDFAAVGSGAGAVMATADALERRGLRLRAFLDIGGFPRSVEENARLFAILRMVQPRVVLFNFFTQVAPCDVLAEAVWRTARETGIPAVARLEGHRAAEGIALLEGHGIPATSSFAAACGGALAAVTGRGA